MIKHSVVWWNVQIGIFLNTTENKWRLSVHKWLADANILTTSFVCGGLMWGNTDILWRLSFEAYRKFELYMIFFFSVWDCRVVFIMWQWMKNMSDKRKLFRLSQKLASVSVVLFLFCVLSCFSVKSYINNAFRMIMPLGWTDAGILLEISGCSTLSGLCF